MGLDKNFIQRGIMQNSPGFLMRAVHPPSCNTMLAENIAVTKLAHVCDPLGALGAIAALTASGTEILAYGFHQMGVWHLDIFLDDSPNLL